MEGLEMTQVKEHMPSICQGLDPWNHMLLPPVTTVGVIPFTVCVYGSSVKKVESDGRLEYCTL